MAVAVTSLAVDAVGPSGDYRSLETAEVRDVRGAVVATLTLAPVPYVNRAVASLRRARPLPVEARIAALGAAAEHFRDGVVDGVGRDEHEHLVARTSGLPITTVHEATDQIADAAETAYERAQAARPLGAVAQLADVPGTGSGVWVRRGGVFGVNAAGNHPGVHSHWLEAVALGYAVAVRPSRREPFTPRRLVSALRTAGLASRLALLPTDHDAADAIIRAVDLAMVYGGDDVIAKYAGSARVLPQGPGRSKILIASGADWRDHVDLVVDSVARGGGTACTNATAVLVEGDAAALAQAVGARLRLLPSHPPEHPDARLPVMDAGAARAVADHVRAVAAGSTPVLGAEDVVDDLGDGSAVVRPSVHLVTGPSSRALQAELSFPCVWVSPWRPDDGVACLGDTLALTVVGAEDTLVDELLASRTVHNVHVGSHPTYWSAPGAPHDGYLGDFLMTTKAVVR